MARGSRKKQAYIHPVSPEEAHIRAVAIEWGRERFPEARLVHQFPFPGENGKPRRLHMAFIGKASIAGIIVKTSKSLLHGLRELTEEAVAVLPEVWVFADIRHEPKLAAGDRPVAANCGIHFVGADGLDHDGMRRGHLNTYSSKDNPRLFNEMLDLLGRAELIAMARRHRLDDVPFGERYDYLKRLSRDLTGQQIREEVCRELRAREHGWPENLPGDPAVPIPIISSRTA